MIQVILLTSLLSLIVSIIAYRKASKKPKLTVDNLKNEYHIKDGNGNTILEIRKPL